MRFVTLVLAAVFLLLKAFGVEGRASPVLPWFPDVDFGWLGVAAFATYFLYKETDEGTKN